METQPQEKLELKRTEEQDLRLFFLIGRKLSSIPEERIIVILAFKLEDAFVRAKTTYPGFGLTYNGQNILMKELLEKLQTEGNVSPPTAQKVEEESLPPEVLSFERFRYGLILAAEEYASENDRETLKNIIKQLKNEPKK